jgi:hypothetical protein
VQGTKAWPAVAVAVLAVAVGNGSSASTGVTTKQTATKVSLRTSVWRREGRKLLRLIVQEQRETWRWERVMGGRLTPRAGSSRHTLGLGYRQWVLNLWTAMARSARRLALHPPHLEGWLCIHRHEGSWGDPNPPYYGGLQMDLGFQATYGRALLRAKGTADHWTPLEQMWVAERAFASGRGFYPWPNTARWCGLI